MEKIFEDEFMDLQADFVWLSMEALGDFADEIYIYISNELTSHMFHTFCKVKGKVKALHELGLPQALISELLHLGTSDIDKINALCNKYNMPAPCELKMHYYVRTRKFEAKYKYEPVCPAESELLAEDIYEDWIREIKDQG